MIIMIIIIILLFNFIYLIIGVVSLSTPHVSVDVLRVVVVSIDEPLNVSGRPLDCEGVVVLAKVLWVLSLSGAMVHIVGRTAAVMDRAHDFMWLITSLLHNVNLSRCSPLAVLAVSRHHPDGWPEIVPTRQFRA